MPALGIALVAVLASLTMGQNFQNGIGRFGVLPGIGGFRSGFGSGGFFGNGALFGGFFNTTITCAGARPGFSGIATLRRSQTFLGPWWLRSQTTVSGRLVFRTTTASGNFILVANERSRVEGGCSSDNMGPVIQRQRRQRFNFFGLSYTRPGIIADVRLPPNDDTILENASLNLPFDDLLSYAGIGLSLCTGLTTDVFGRQVCVDPVFACCKLGFDNREAVLLPVP